ncbi:hypothetical protein [Streptomyces sp. NPDC058291]|uniref:hypothetical protein n=1 Tax=Streptomyces sp. NPDC058291 TaxID=3346427 RepID=UPI0036E374A2
MGARAPQLMRGLGQELLGGGGGQVIQSEPAPAGKAALRLGISEPGGALEPRSSRT